MKTTIEFEEETIDVDVDYNFYSGDPGLWSYSNGDPGYPPSGPEVEVMHITDASGKDYVDLIDSKEMERILELIISQEPAEPDFD